jgi:hypothetical protein
MLPVCKNIESNYYNSLKNFYVCSYGGCGSWMLVKYLSNYGNVYHIHSRYPPQKLTLVGSDNIDYAASIQSFGTVEVDNPTNTSVIYLYRNPINAIYSRFHLPEHLYHINCDTNITIDDVIEKRQDLYKLEEFFDNYTTPNNRNYKIYCVKYEEFFDNIKLFNDTIGITDDSKLYPIKVERNKHYENYDILGEIYNSLLLKMDKLKFIECII